ncbi:MAG: hypothetical protein FJ100_11010 [Deltaproteobacteria bacterium]|nr:hypothetical protein [Deltaproteobacteria bacterium]
MTAPATPAHTFADRAALPAQSWIVQLAQGLRRPAVATWILVVGSAILLLGTQGPQARAPWPTTDGLSRADLQVFAAMGGSTLGRSLVLHVWAAVAIGAALLHWRWSRSDRWLVARGLALVGAVTSGVAWVAVDGAASAPLWVDVPIDADGGALPIGTAWRNDHGRLAPAPGTMRGRCTPVDAHAVHCRIQGQGRDIDCILGVGVSGTGAGASLHWVGTLPGADSAWTATVATPAGRQLAIPLVPGQTVAVPDWGNRRAIPVGSAVAGPIVVTASAGAARLWAAPRLVGASSTAAPMHLRSGARARLLLAEPSAGLPLWVATVVLLAVAVAAGPSRRIAA